tara:strand:- start:3438 stop:4682 length:1245 start_codon:yes stop_codon:yes gene_type:complete
MSNGAINELIDPIRHSSNRLTEFRLDKLNSVYLPSLRLLNVGATSSVAHSYTRLAGVYGVIKNIMLMDGGTVLDSMKECNRYMSFKNYLNPNSVNDSRVSGELLHQMGFRLKKQAAAVRVDLGSTPTGTNTTPTTTTSGVVHLANILPLLQNIDYLHTGVFTNLRIVIEYETKSTKIIVVDNATTSTLEPLLSVDVISDPSIVQQLTPQALNQQVEFFSIENDLFRVAQKDATTNNQPLKQKTKVLINGFNNKFVRRIMMSKEYSDDTKNSGASNAITGFGALGSRQQFRELHDLIINKVPIIPDGINSEATQLSMLNQSWGESNTYIGANMYSQDNIANDQFDGRNYCGGAGYVGVNVNELIKNFQYSYERQVLHDTTATSLSNEGLICHIFGEVKKVLNVQNGKYEVMYVSD